MTAVHPQDNPYSVAVAAVRAEQAQHQARFNDGRGAYNRFYDLASSIGADRAKEALPEEARIVADLEASLPDRDRQVSAMSEALKISLEAEMRSIAEASVMAEGSVISRLRSDLKQLGRYRKENLDGIDGQFWDVLRQGHGASKKELDRMLNRILAAWCGIYEIKPVTMTDAAMALDMIYVVGTHWNMSSAAVTEKCKSYPFDLVADLEEAKSWEELDPDAVEALLQHLQPSRDLSR